MPPTVSGTVTDKSGNTAAWSTSWTVASPPPTGLGPIVGMSAFPETWAPRMTELGTAARAEVGARRLFIQQLDSAGRGQEPLIRQALADDMIPVLSYKVPSVSTLISGGYDIWLANLRAFLVSLNTLVFATWHHEPHGDMTAAEFRDGSRRFFDRVKAPDVMVGPILNGWLLQNQAQTTFKSYTSAALLADWDFLGADTYRDGVILPATLIGKLRAFCNTEGRPDLPIVIGEYNGDTEQDIADAGEAILNPANKVWIGNVWNNTGGIGVVLSGARLEAYKATLVDSRNLGKQ